MAIQYYHFHIYFDKSQQKQTKDLVEKLKVLGELEIGRIHDRPVGPHPIGSCQIKVPAGKMEEMMLWFFEERGDLDIFIHGVTGDDLLDHTKYTAWMGRSYELNLDMFRTTSKP
ncbi:MAG: DOPA 4,5-dioxygenase family protein [Pseudobacteriovorax sp.]|nr:DOPA 4,5-dioxygenase family protein [Pseudobacteriovorax sp.]